MDFVNSLADWELWLMLAAGVAVMFAGYRIKKIAFFIIWFLLGYNLIGFLMPEITKLLPQIAENNLWKMLVPIAGGLLLALLGFSIEKVCVSGVCFVLTMLIAIQQFGTGMQVLIVAGIIAVIVAGASVMLMKPATIVATSVAGAYALTMALITLFARMNGADLQPYYWALLGTGSALGSLVQFLTTKHVS
ncbi:DUF4203 domain-containing protein [Candidatus Saccharibacteria bacterium]|nr:DUF4203 domain-containing protein [Candidatus Saccharibacteria bacterium]